MWVRWERWAEVGRGGREREGRKVSDEMLKKVGVSVRKGRERYLYKRNSLMSFTQSLEHRSNCPTWRAPSCCEIVDLLVSRLGYLCKGLYAPNLNNSLCNA
jgi:hypothetical protein